MRGNGLYWATAISAFAHAAFFFLALVILKQSDVHINTSAYVVDLVDSIPQRAAEPARPQPKPEVQPEAKPQADAKKLLPLETAKPVSKSTMNYVAEKLKAIERQKADANHAAQRLADLESKKRFENIRQSASIRADAERVVSDTSRSEHALEEYYSRVRDKIMRAWVYPDLGPQAGIEAVVSVTVQANGRISVNRIERTSGNAIFDRSTLRAIAKSSPVAPPPFGAPLEIGVRFSPDEK